MEQKIRWSVRSLRQLQEIDQRYAQNIKARVNELQNFPQVAADIKKIEKKYRLRVGNYRIFFEVIEGVPRIIEVQEILRRQSKTYK